MHLARYLCGLEALSATMRWCDASHACDSTIAMALNCIDYCRIMMARMVGSTDLLIEGLVSSRLSATTFDSSSSM